MRTTTVEVKVKLLINADEGVEISEVIDGMEYKFHSPNSASDIVDSEILDFEVKDSR